MVLWSFGPHLHHLKRWIMTSLFQFNIWTAEWVRTGVSGDLSVREVAYMRPKHFVIDYMMWRSDILGGLRKNDCVESIRLFQLLPINIFLFQKSFAISAHGGWNPSANVTVQFTCSLFKFCHILLLESNPSRPKHVHCVNQLCVPQRFTRPSGAT